ncbi:MAG: hypothetical protein AUJ85_10430 [Elusimicrobia bacterium CG1_02_37_114]|nr:MAG: hypothetical protein AUJ85_10430 [Elusimicrobia bacterium CG1_02_37_114]PIV52837.1 MAG: hypothetical protein COS17_07075 [Elusimicrobia bacterium CG02_land_8_20_14_3_00_37_13]PIZ13752.1 MAG: hypothetical protein COY53_03210 [Elusimicrobia bacterium CG_4_10_14_0_8_um_filter_37_32]
MITVTWTTFLQEYFRDKSATTMILHMFKNDSIKIIVLLLLLSILKPNILYAESKNYELHFLVGFAGTYGVTKICENRGASKLDSRLIALGIMSILSLGKEYVYDPEPDKNDLLYDGLGMCLGLIVLEW